MPELLNFSICIAYFTNLVKFVNLNKRIYDNRKEIAKGQKNYFYDPGVGNSLIQNFNPMSIRNDAGGLWENFCIVERLKMNKNQGRFVNRYFWRTYDQKENRPD